MELYEADQMARELMDRHGLSGWSFGFDRARRRFGCCVYRHRRITLSRTLTLMNSADQVRQTLLHEIAHALAPWSGHGPKWRAMCQRLGIPARRCYTDQEVLSPPRRSAPMLIGCERCGWWADRHRRTRRRLVCRTCRGPVVIRAKATG